MKRLIFLILIISCIFFLSSCSKQKDYLLTGKKAEIKDLTLVSIIWYKLGTTGWEIVRTWDTNDPDMKTIRQLIMDAEGEGELPWRRWYKLSLFFYDGVPENLKLKEITFDFQEVSEKNILFEGSVGASYPLGNLLSKYWFETRDSGVIPERKSMIEESEKAHRAAIKALKEKEANQP